MCLFRCTALPVANRIKMFSCIYFAVHYTSLDYEKFRYMSGKKLSKATAQFDL